MSKLEEQLAQQIKAAGLPEPEREFKFSSARKWRLDFAWPAAIGTMTGARLAPIAAEAEGGTWAGGRHTTGAGFAKDCEKYNQAALMGWRVFRFTGDMIRTGQALDIIKRALT